MEKEESIDLRELFQLAILNKKRILSIIVVCTLIAMVTAFFILPKTYESSVLVRAKATSAVGGAGAAMAALGLGGGASSPLQGYMEMMKSRAVIDPLIAKVDIKEEVREKMLAADFVKGYLEISNSKGTDLIEIIAKSKSPEEAKMVAEDVVSGFLTLMTRLNQNEQSLVMKFLTERIGLSEKEMAEAEDKLEAFRQEKKLFVPDAQVQAVVAKMTAYDNSLSDLKANTVSEQANVQNAIEQLRKQNMALKEFNVNDNEDLRGIRNAILGKEMKLIELERLYTEKHPTVTLLQEEIVELNAKLKAEVVKAVESGTVTLNPIHAGLLMAKVQAESAIVMNDAHRAKIEELLQKAEADISGLSMESMKYMKLQRDVNVTRDVYGSLVKNYENARIQAAMDSMDIQIVDPADYPKKPAGPRKLLITAIGGVIGVLFAFGYLLLLYSRRENALAVHK